eukprot:1138504-Pelagomonas_calceolata.AAC.7
MKYHVYPGNDESQRTPDHPPGLRPPQMGPQLHPRTIFTPITMIWRPLYMIRTSSTLKKRMCLVKDDLFGPCAGFPHSVHATANQATVPQVGTIKAYRKRNPSLTICQSGHTYAGACKKHLFSGLSTKDANGSELAVFWATNAVALS